MKIIKKAKMPRITCNLCGCVYRPHPADIKHSLMPSECTTDADYLKKRIFTSCPVCGLIAYPYRTEDQSNG